MLKPLGLMEDMLGMCRRWWRACNVRWRQWMLRDAYRKQWSCAFVGGGSGGWYATVEDILYLWRR